MTNIAQRSIEYYDHQDFKSNYFDILFESFNNEEGIIIDRIYDKFAVSNYETKEYLSNYKYLDKVQCKKVYDYIVDNFESFMNDFRGYYVGYTSLDSVVYGEQEEQISGLYNHKTGKLYNLKYMQRIFKSEGYTINNDLAYYNLDGGLHIDLLGNIEGLNKLLTTF